jgi:hypothetical protein
MYVITADYHVHERAMTEDEQANHASGRCATPARYPVHHLGGGAMSSAARKVSSLRGDGVDLAAAADAFLSTARMSNPNTHRAYAGAIDRTAHLLPRLLAFVEADGLGRQSRHGGQRTDAHTVRLRP